MSTALQRKKNDAKDAKGRMLLSPSILAGFLSEHRVEVFYNTLKQRENNYFARSLRVY